MEIAAFFRLSARRLVLLGGLALLAAILTAASTYLDGPVYEAEVVMHGARVFPPGTADYELRPFVDDFAVTLDDPDVVRATADATGVPGDDIEAGIEYQRIDDGTNVVVAYQSEDREETRAVADAAAHSALAVLADVELQRATAALTTAEEAESTAGQALAEFEAANGDTFDLDPGAGPDEITRILELRSQHDALVAESARTQDAIDDARGRVDLASTRVAESASPALVTTRDTQQLSRLPALIRGALSAVVVVTALGLLVLVAVDWRQPEPGRAATDDSPSRRRRGRRAPRPSPAPAEQPTMSNVGSGRT